MTQAKFRVWDGRRFHHWGFLQNLSEGTNEASHLPASKSINNLIFVTPTNFNPPVSFEEVQKRSQQFTGLKDKNGKEIYEGDIVKHRNGISEIIFNHLSFTIDNKEEFESCLHEWWTGDLEVIGNIYENPELIQR